MPLRIKSLPEGTLCPIGIPCTTITNTVAHAYWLPNYLETILSTTVWQGMTSATIAYNYYKLLSKYAIETTGSNEFVQWQGHDFSMRGMSSLETACVSGAGHLLSFTGTDTIPSIEWLEKYYNANVEKELIGASVPATEHSVMCMGTKEKEIETFKYLIDKYPKGILSIVSDTWNLWDVLTKFMPTLKNQIIERDGKVVIRPDSGDPVDILCGNETCNPHTNSAEFKGVIELLWDVFGGNVNEKGYKVLDKHIGAIYGDSITLERAEQICERLKLKGFASTNVVLGIGSYTYQYNTRDTFGFAMKATYGEVLVDGKIEKREIWKDPITDDGTKKSAKGLIYIGKDIEGNYYMEDQVSKTRERDGELKVIFENGVLIKNWTLQEVRNNLKNAK
jgi:nicotinamide phosphoribosyltransferase